MIDLPALSLGVYRFVIAAVDPLYLPPYKGSTLRGALGRALKVAACLGGNPQGKPCDVCREPGRCAYGYLFETPLPQGAAALRGYSEVPHPLIIETADDRRTDIAPGDRLEGRFILIGRGLEYLAYVIAALKIACEDGLGKGRGRACLVEVWAEHPYTATMTRLYSARNAPVAWLDEPLTGQDITGQVARLPGDRLTVRFLTPTRLVHGSHMVERPEFHVLVRALLRRISSLAYFHCGQRWEIDFKAAIAAAEQVRLAACDIHWLDWERYSSRQQTRMKLGGLVGSATYEGDVRSFLPLVALGELVHVGKATSFGDGQYCLVRDREGVG